MEKLTIRIQFDRDTLTPSGIFYDNSETDMEDAKMRKYADIMLKALPDQEAGPTEKPAP